METTVRYSISLSSYGELVQVISVTKLFAEAEHKFIFYRLLGRKSNSYLQIVMVSKVINKLSIIDLAFNFSFLPSVSLTVKDSESLAPNSQNLFLSYLNVIFLNNP